jgi:hypothetical protein
MTYNVTRKVSRAKSTAMSPLGKGPIWLSMLAETFPSCPVSRNHYASSVYEKRMDKATNAGTSGDEHMNANYVLALRRQLKSAPNTPGIGPHPFNNHMPIPIRLQFVDERGVLYSAEIDRKPNTFKEVAPGEFTGSYTQPGQVYLATTAFSGALIGVIEIMEHITSFDVSPVLLTHPNDIGTFPTPSENTLIPVDSPRVLVACGKAANEKIVAREQFWKRSDESYTLAPHQTHTIGFSTTSGMQETTSEQETIAASLGLSASAGWGAISASVSSSLSSFSTTFQQVTVTSQETRYETIELTNDTARTQTFFKWQLMDIITVFEGMTPAATILLAQAPTLIGGPY